MAEAALASGPVMCFKTHNTNLFQYFHINNNYKLSIFDSSKNAPQEQITKIKSNVPTSVKMQNVNQIRTKVNKL